MKYFSKSNKIFAVLTGFCLLMATACSEEREPAEAPAQGRNLEYTHQVTFLNREEKPVTSIEVALADEPTERNEGLMDVNSLPPDKGMLFIFQEQQPLSFWMANTPLSLDIIFVNENKEIVRIHHSTQPFTQEDFPSGKPARYVIETNAGFCISHDIREGMQVEWQKLEST